MNDEIQRYFPYDINSAREVSLRSISSIEFGYYRELQHIRNTKCGIKPVCRSIFTSSESAKISAESNRTEGTAFRICAINTLFFWGERYFIFFENNYEIKFKELFLKKELNIKEALQTISQRNQLWFGLVNFQGKKKIKEGWDLYSKSYGGSYLLCWSREKSSTRRYKKINLIRKCLAKSITVGACC
ncbi:hypothetical protein V6582_15525 [Agrobacterium vitis]|uniref:hypothetical protein n=1 Tax=Agrobacterium vitis TaxID=373 RepID=UPI0012E91361|nr:hypothetical protein [Agrobacterium vitis]MVA23588.1 hypothetical protein [Agrobacterium vitis]